MKVMISAKIDPALLEAVDAALADRPTKVTRTAAIEEGLRLLLKAWARTKGFTHAK